MQTDSTENTAPPGADSSQDAAPPPPAAKEPTVIQRSLALVKTTIKEFDSAEAGLARLRKRYENVVFNVSTTKGMKEACDARMAIREPRYAVKTALDAAKKPLNALKADITARAEALTAEIMKLETPIHEQIVAEESRKAKEKADREAADRARILAITERIGAIRATAARAGECRTAARVSEILKALLATDMTGFDEFENEAIAALTAATETVTKIRDAKESDEREREERRLAQEAEEARLKKQREDLEAQQAEMAAAQKKLDDERAAFQAQLAAAAAPAEVEKPAPAEPAAVEWKAPAHAPLASHQAQANAFEFMTGAPVITDADVREQPAQVAEDRQGAIVDAELPADFASVVDGAADAASVRAGFDAAMQSTYIAPLAETDPNEIDEQQLVDIAIEAVAGFFDITEQQAAVRLAGIRQWNYQGHALAA